MHPGATDLAEVLAAKHRLGSAQPQVSSNNHCHVVVIDDDHLSLFMLKTLLNKTVEADTEVALQLFSDSEAALQHLKNLSFDSPVRIFLDIHMPYYDAWDVLEILKAIAPAEADLKVILQSAGISPQDRLKANSYPMVKDLVCKPLTAVGIKKLLNL